MSLKEAISKYLQENGLVAKMNERNIKLEDIEKYVIDCARKELDSKDGAIDDKTVFGWAVHYVEDAYKEKDKVEEDNEPKPEVKVVAPEPKKDKYEQMSLFDLI